MPENETEKISAYNEAVQKIGRIARLQEEANQCAKEGDWNGWYGNLTIIYLEISSKLSEDQIEEIEKEIRKCNRALIAYNNLNEARYQGLKVEQCSVPNHNNIYNLLFRLDFKIRKLVDESGYGSPDKEDELF